jgi:hypothetical protein
VPGIPSGGFGVMKRVKIVRSGNRLATSTTTGSTRSIHGVAHGPSAEKMRCMQRCTACSLRLCLSSLAIGKKAGLSALMAKARATRLADYFRSIAPRFLAAGPLLPPSSPGLLVESWARVWSDAPPLPTPMVFVRYSHNLISSGPNEPSAIKSVNGHRGLPP